MSNISAVKKQLSFKVQTAAALAAVAAAVVIPQIFHIFGAVFGVGTSLGEIFLPMHIPIILVGFLAGPYAGAIAGLLGPLASFVLTRMPTSFMLPFIMIELCTYGLAAGLIKDINIPSIFKVLLVQVSGRIIRSIMVLISVYAFGNMSIKVSSVWMSVVTGIGGIILQLIVIPLIIYGIEKLKKDEN